MIRLIKLRFPSFQRRLESSACLKTWIPACAGMTEVQHNRKPMIKISKLADYATVVMAYMASKSDSVHKARDIAKHTHIALPTVSKILKLIARCGLLESQRGAKGGYQLTRYPEKITVTEIIKAMDGEFAMTECSHLQGNCSIESTCSIRSNWRMLSNTIYQALDCITLADMVQPRLFKKLQHKVALDLRKTS
jgi:FeS assembly SUF system regulator